MNNVLRNAVLLSVFIHAAFVAPFGIGRQHREKPRRDDLVIDYVVLHEPKAVEITRAEPAKPKETPRIEIRPKAEVAPAQSAPAARADSSKTKPSELAKEQASIQSTEDYINYYQLIREKIRQEVKRRYRRSHNEGEVNLTFILTSKGALAACEPDPGLSVKDRPLIEIAASSLRSAAPFPPFPKGLAMPRVAFSITVVFKKDR